MVALTPRLAGRTNKRGWIRLFGADGYLLQVAVFQALLFAACDLAFSIMMTTSMHTFPCFLFACTAAALWHEIDQVYGRPTSRSQGFWGQLRSYFQQDVFNSLDILALLVSITTLGAGLWIVWVLQRPLQGEGYYIFARQRPALTSSYENGASLAVLLLWLRQASPVLVDLRCCRCHLVAPAAASSSPFPHILLCVSRGSCGSSR